MASTPSSRSERSIALRISTPSSSASFAGSGRDALSWVLDGYFVVIAALLVPAGGLADRFGHKRIFMLGVASFTAASLLCAAAPSLGLLIAFRVVQGIGAAMIAPASLAIVLDSFPVERRAAGVSDGAFLFAVIASLVAGAVTLTLRPVSKPAGAEDTDTPEAPAAVSYETAST